MVFQIYDSSSRTWVDMVQYWAFRSLDSTDNDIDGPNAGRSTSGLMQRDYLGTKMKWNFTSIPLPIATARSLIDLVRPETFFARTDIATGSLQRFTCYSNNRVLTPLLQRQNGDELAKASFPIIEM